MTNASTSNDPGAHERGHHEDHWAAVRHDLRTPLNQILGYGEMLLEDAEADGRQEAVADLQKIRLAVSTMLDLIQQHLQPQAVLQRAGQSEVAAGQAAIDGAQHAIEFLAEGDEDGSAGSELRGTVLIVDDHPLNRDLLARKLQRHGLEVVTADDGESALQVLGERGFDLVLLDVLMPRRNGYETLQAIKLDAQLRHVPVIMISALDEIGSVIRCIEAGAEDYLPKPFNPTLLRARISACLEKKRLRDSEQNWLQQIEKTQRRLSRELQDAEKYVRSLFPAPLEDRIAVTWHHQSCSELGGDAFGYHWLDDQHFAIYLLDVCGHGVGPSLLAASALNVIRTGTLPAADMLNPSSVLAALNQMFSMEKQNNMYFTLWYGVFCTTTRELKVACAGHPAGILLTAAENQPATQRTGNFGMVIGAFDGMDYDTDCYSVPEQSELYIFSDGCYEVQQEDGTMLQVEDLERFLCWQDSRAQAPSDWYQTLIQRAAGGRLDDDFTMLRVRF